MTAVGMVSLMAGDGLFKLELDWVVVGWQLWLSLMVGACCSLAWGGG